MGHAMGSQRYRIDMEDLWRAPDEGGVRLEIEAVPLVGRRSGDMPTTLVDFVLDADLGFTA